MGVVRRQEDWRLEKRRDGVYEITYKRKVELKVHTPDYQPEVTEIPAVDVVPVQEVGSYPEVEGLFEEHAHGGPPDDFEPPSGDTGDAPPDEEVGSIDSSPDISAERGEDDDFWRLPPGGLALAFLVVGASIIYSAGDDPGSAVFLVGLLFALGGIAIIGWAALLHRTRGWSAARAFLTSVGDAADEG